MVCWPSSILFVAVGEISCYSVLKFFMSAEHSSKSHPESGHVHEHQHHIVLEEKDEDSDSECGRHSHTHKKTSLKSPHGTLSVSSVAESSSAANTKKLATHDGEGLGGMAVKPWLGAIVAPTHPPAFNVSEPEKKLVLEWIYGYTCVESRNNIAVSSTGQFIYPSAAVVIVYDAKSNTQAFFRFHTDDVSALSIHPNKTTVASGQVASLDAQHSAPPLVHVWDCQSPSSAPLSTIHLHQDDRSVKSLSFSADGKLLAILLSDDSHTVKVYDWHAKKLLSQTHGDTNPCYQVRWHSVDVQHFYTVGKRHAQIHTFDGSSIKSHSILLGKEPLQTFFSVTFSNKGNAILGTFDGSLYVSAEGKVTGNFSGVHSAGKVFALGTWSGGIVSGGSDKKLVILDKTLKPIKSIKFLHKINAVAVHGGDVLVGTQGGRIFFIQDFASTDNTEEAQFSPVTSGHFDGELWPLDIAADSRFFFSAGEDNSVNVWDSQQHKLVKSAKLAEKADEPPKVRKAATSSLHAVNQCARALSVSPDGKWLAIGMNSGVVQLHDAHTLQLILTQDLNKLSQRKLTTVHQDWIQTIEFNPAGTVLAVGTHGSVIALLDVTDGFKVKGKVTSHNAFLTALDWSKDGAYLRSTDGGYELLFHHISSDLSKVSQVTSVHSLKDVVWNSFHVPFGWHVQGIFEKGEEGNNINCVDANVDLGLLATGDDSGRVNLFRYPALEGAKKNSFAAHSSHVPTVKFAKSGKFLLSTGGHDLAVMQWTIQ